MATRDTGGQAQPSPSRRADRIEDAPPQAKPEAPERDGEITQDDDDLPATMGNLIANRDIEKVHAADRSSLVGIAGTAGVGIELIRLFQVELQHYEKIEGVVLSLDGKANRLATMIRNNLGAALQGLAVVPLFAGFDVDARSADRAGRIFSFDVAGGVYEERGYDSIGSGSPFAKASLKKRFRPGLTTDEAV